MDKTIILGGYGFLGFHLTTAFLDIGEEVLCVHVESCNDYFLDEKRLMVGRNANFSEMTLADWRIFPFNPDEKNLMIVSLYDFYLKNEREGVMADIETSFEHHLERGDLKNCQVVFMLPVQTLTRENRSFINICKGLEKKDQPYKCIFLPTLYGPWQPADYVFQQTLLCEVNGDGEPLLNENEWVFDAIYISDAVAEIMNNLDQDTIKECLLKSSYSNHWEKCAEFLSLPSELYLSARKLERIEHTILQIEVKPSIEYDQGLKQQKLHLLRILSSG